MKLFRSSEGRVGLIDEIRGFAILCMVFYHAGFDLVFLFGVSMPFFTSDPMNFIRDCFIGLFVLISGVAAVYSKNNLKRGLIVLGCGLILTAGTFLFMYSARILFGVLHMLGSCMILYALLAPLLKKCPALPGGIVSLFLFLLTLGLPSGVLGIPEFLEYPLPAELYSTTFLFPIGFPHETFFSGDYMPIFPWFFLFVTGTFIGRPIKAGRFPGWIYKTHIPPLAAIGRNTIWIHLLHQPVIYGILWLIFFLIR
ncbi:MAG: DUF1624 domain-containing protein [Ruminococcaceae bacterium]|nr:DUF1624 domain-containing protein [Oscillospiraceae bacterium]